jgi:single stranded DNA-binding protein
MSDINSISLTGRLVADPTVSYTPTGAAVTKFRLASDRVWTDQNAVAEPGEDGQPKNRRHETLFVSCVAWNGLGTALAQYQNKGDRIGITGRLVIREYTDRDGGRAWMTEVVLTAPPSFLSKAANGAQQPATQPAATTPAEPATRPAVHNGKETKEVPF